VKPARLLLILGAGCVALIALFSVLMWLALPTLIEAEVKKRAREQGVELTLGTLDFGWEWAELRKSKAVLIGVPGLELGIDRLNVDLDGTKLTRLDFTGLTLEASGSVPALALSLGAWSKKYPSAFALPLSARNVSVRFRPEPSQPAWLELSGGTVATTAAGTIVAAEHTQLAGIDVGRVGATWTATASSVALGLGESDLARAPVRVAVDLSSARPKLAFQLVPTALERLAGPFAVALPVHGVSASATVALEFANAAAEFPEKGAAHLELHGWIPPHPAELDGFVFGDTTVVDTTLAFSPDGKRVTLDPTHLTAGRFELAGPGSLVRDADAATLDLDLKGALPCDALASAAAESRVGRLLGRVQGGRAGSVARQAIGGTVSIRVQISASTKNLAGASLKRSIGIGCGLKPLTLDDVLRLGETLLPADLSELQEDIVKLTPKLPNGAPLIPSILPPLPPLPLPALPTNLPDFTRPPPAATSARPGAATSARPGASKPSTTKPAPTATPTAR
jgi:hypothetical protein